jgi:hypothetical protein
MRRGLQKVPIRSLQGGFPPAWRRFYLQEHLGAFFLDMPLWLAKRGVSKRSYGLVKVSEVIKKAGKRAIHWFCPNN